MIEPPYTLVIYGLWGVFIIAFAAWCEVDRGKSPGSSLVYSILVSFGSWALLAALLNHWGPGVNTEISGLRDGLVFRAAAQLSLPLFVGTGYALPSRRWPDAIRANLGSAVLVGGASVIADYPLFFLFYIPAVVLVVLLSLIDTEFPFRKAPSQPVTLRDDQPGEN
jgi:hypothetical protein